MNRCGGGGVWGVCSLSFGLCFCLHLRLSKSRRTWSVDMCIPHVPPFSFVGPSSPLLYSCSFTRAWQTCVLECFLWCTPCFRGSAVPQRLFLASSFIVGCFLPPPHPPTLAWQPIVGRLVSLPVHILVSEAWVLFSLSLDSFLSFSLWRLCLIVCLCPFPSHWGSPWSRIFFIGH